MKKKTIRKLGLDKGISPRRPHDLAARLRTICTELALLSQDAQDALERVEAQPADTTTTNAD